jgi:hypothetical protein
MLEWRRAVVFREEGDVVQILDMERKRERTYISLPPPTPSPLF